MIEQAIGSVLFGLGVGLVCAVVFTILALVVAPLIVVGFAWLVVTIWDGFDRLRGHSA